MRNAAGTAPLLFPGDGGYAWGMPRSIKVFILPVLLGLGLFAFLGLLGSGVFLLREAADVHPALGWLVGVLLATALGLLVVYPVIQVLRLPRALAPPRAASGPGWERFVRRYARRLSRNKLLRDGCAEYESLCRAAADASRPLTEVEHAVEEALTVLDGKAEAVIRRHAALVFTTTAVSQSGRLDTVIVLSAQFRMVKEVAEVYYQRPGVRDLWRLYANVGASGFVAGEIQDSELLAVLGAPVSAGITSFIPVAGASPLVTLLVNSLLDGSANAFLTLRIGVLARRYAGLRIEPDRRLMARSAALEAAALLGGVVGQGAGRVANLTRRLIVERAARGTTRAAKGIAGAGVSLFEKIAGLVGKAGTAAAETTTEGIRFLQESLRFWDTVATTAGPDAAAVSDSTPAGTVSGTTTVPGDRRE
jgi:hypothetical protein